MYSKEIEITSSDQLEVSKAMATDSPEVERLQATNAELLAALEAIEGGNFTGASEMAVNGQWHDFATALQEIARVAKAKAGKE